MFQYSHLSRLDHTISEAWTTEQSMEYWTMVDSLGNRSRIAQVSINNPLNTKERAYSVMQRVRILDAYGITAFLGRIISIVPSFTENRLILTCRDYLGELSDRVILAESGDGKYTASSRNGLLSKLVEEESEEPEVGQDMDRTLLPRMLQDTGNYLESITKTYSIRGMYGLDPSTRTAANYNYRGATTVIEALSQVSSEDAQQDLQVFYYTDTPSDPDGDAYINDSKRFPSTYWVDHTGGISDGTEVFSTPRHVVNAKSVYGTTTGTPLKDAGFPSTVDATQQNDIMYFGSNSKFDGIEYTFRQSGGKIHESNYDELEWQYWDGKHWTRFVPDYDTKFKADSRDTETVTGRAEWSSLISDTSMTNTVAGKNTPTAVSTQLNGAASANTVPFAIDQITVDSTANLSVGGIIQVGANDANLEAMRIISIDGNTLTVYRNYPGTAKESSNAHADNSKVLGGHKQGMADWAKRDLAQSIDMHSYSNGNTSVYDGSGDLALPENYTDNARWKSWKNPYQSNSNFDYFRVPPGTAQLTTYDAPYPTGAPRPHGLRTGDRLKGTNFTGWEKAQRSYNYQTVHGGSLYPNFDGARGYPHTHGFLGVWIDIPADRTDTLLLVTIYEMARDNSIPTSSFKTGVGSPTNYSGYAYFGPYNGTNFNGMSQMGHLAMSELLDWSSANGWTASQTRSQMKTFIVENPASGTQAIAAYPGSGGDGIGTRHAYGIMCTLFSGVNNSGAHPTVGAGAASGYSNTTSATQSIDITTAPGDWVYSKWLVSRPGHTNTYNYTASHDKAYAIGDSNVANTQLNQSLWTSDNSGNGNGTWSFRFGHQAASIHTTTTSPSITVANSGGLYKWAGTAIRIRNKYPGGEVGDGGFLNGDNYAEVLTPYTINLWDHFKGNNNGTYSFSNATQTNNYTTRSSPINEGSIDVTEKSGASATETLLEVGGSVRTDDVTSTAIPSMNIGEGRGTYKYWVRCFVRKSAIYGYIDEASNTNSTNSFDVEKHPHANHTQVQNATDFSAGDVITVRGEDLLVTGNNGNNQISVTRGHNGTTAVANVRGDAVNGTKPAELATVSLYTPAKTFRDFRAEDPKPFDEIWRYSSDIASTTLSSAVNNSTTSIPVTSAASFALDDVITIDSEDMLITGISSNTLTVTRGFNSGAEVTGDKAAHDDESVVSVSLYSENNHDMTGGLWTSLNRTGGNSGSGSSLLWSGIGNTTPVLSDNTEMIYVGSEEPFNGIEFSAQQGKSLQITEITQANPAVISCADNHGLSTGDYVVITGSNSGVSVDGYHQVTRLSFYTFSVAINNTGAVGTGGSVLTGVPDYSNVSMKFDVLDTFPRNYWGAGTDGRIDTSTAWRTIQVQGDNYNDLSWGARANVGSLASSFPFGPFGPSRWRYDGGLLGVGSLNWANEIRFNTDKPRNNQALKDAGQDPDRILPPVNPIRELGVSEYDLAYQMSNSSTWSTRASIIGPYSSHSMVGARASHNNATTSTIRASSTAYVGSTTDITMTFTTAHHCAVGDYIIFTNADGNSLDGVYRVKTVTSRYILTFDCGRTGLSFSANDDLSMTRISNPPNTKNLYWMRIRVSGTPRTPITLRHARMASNARFKYFDRGKEPWPLNKTTSARGSAANGDLDAVYTYDASKGFNSTAATTLGAAISSTTATSVTASNGGLLTPGQTIKIDSEEIYISSISGNTLTVVRGVNETTAATHSNGASIYADSLMVTSTEASLGYTEFTTSIAHGLTVGDTIQIAPDIVVDATGGDKTDSDHNEGIWQVERVTSTTKFVINKFHESGTDDTGALEHLVHLTKFRDITADVASDSVDTQALTIASSGTGQPGTIRTDQEHEFRPDDVIIFAGTSNSPPTGNVYRVNEVIYADEFTYRVQDGTFVNVTTPLTDTGTVRSYTAIAKCEAADAGKITTENEHNLKEGQVITIVGTSIGSLNTTTHVKEVLTPTIFTVNIDIASTGTAHQGYINTDPVGITSAVGDAIYFGSHSPFTQLRIDSLTSSLADGGTGAGVWEYYRGDNTGLGSYWASLDVNDLTGGFKGYSIDNDYEVSFFAPGFGLWKSCKAGVADASTQESGGQIHHLNKTFGNQYYFVRYRFTTAAASAISLSRVWCGPNFWNSDLETNTISGTTNRRHATDLISYGINLDDREITQNEGSNVRVTSYALKDNSIEFVNVVTVRGIAGAYATARNEASIRKFRVVKEKVIDDTSLVNDIQCMQRAKAVLEQLGAKAPIDILNITAARPSVVTTGGTYKYLSYTDNNNPMNVTLFESKGLEIVSNSAENNKSTTLLNGAVNNSVTTLTVDSSADFIVDHVILIGTEQMLVTAVPSATTLTVVRSVNGTTAASQVDNAEVFIFNRTYINTESAHNLDTGDRILITDVSNTAPRFQGIGAFSTTANENTMSYNYIHKIVVTGQKQFYVQTADSVLTGTGALAHQMSVLNTSANPDTTTALDNSFDAAGSIIHPMAPTSLQVGDKIRLVGGVHSATNSLLSTVSQVHSEGSVVQLDGVGAGTTPTDILGYAYISEPHGLQTGDSIRISGTNSVPSIDGYRTVTKLTDSTFSINANLSSGTAGSDGVILPTTIREATVKIDAFPVFTANNGMPKVLRAGDLANVSLYNAGIVNEPWLVYSIITGAVDGGVEISLFRDLSAVSEPGDSEKQLLRDLSSHLRETANAVFQPIDKAVENALDFLPEGPSRPSLRIEMQPTGTENTIDIPSPGLLAGTHTQSFPDDFRLSWKMYENFPTRETVDKDLLRVDMQGLRADDTGDASGGAGITFIGRDKVTGNTGSTPNFHPDDGEATLYLRDSETPNEGRGLYLSHRGIFNSADTFDEWDTDTPKLQAEVFVGLSGRATASGSGAVTVTLPTLAANPRIIATTESNGYVHVTNSTTSATLTARDAAGNTISGAIINYIVVYNSSSNNTGLNSHY